MSPEIQEASTKLSTPSAMIQDLINTLYGETPAPPEPPTEDHSPRMRNRVREIRSAQTLRLGLSETRYCHIHPNFEHPLNEQCIGCALDLDTHTCEDIMLTKKEKTGLGGKHANDPENLYPEKNLNALKAAINDQNERMYSMDTMPSYCSTHDWYYNEQEMCIHCQMMLPPVWWQGKIGKPEYSGAAPDSSFLKFDSSKHLFLNKHYSIMPRGTTLTTEEIVEKIPALVEVAPDHIKTSIKEVLVALAENTKTFPSHIYHDPSGKQVKVVWFDPLGETNYAVTMYSTSDKSPAWEKSTVHPWRIAYNGIVKPAATAAEGIGIVEGILVTRRGAEPTPVVASEPVEDDDEDEDEDDEPSYDNNDPF